MFVKSFAYILIVASSFVLVTGQTPDVQRDNAEKPAQRSSGTGIKRLRDLPFPTGVDLQFIIKELARDLDLNVMFDIDSFRTAGRKTYIDLRNVSSAAALDYILLQERLFFEEAGPRAILVASQIRQRINSPKIGVGGAAMTEQLAHYFGVDGGILIDTVRFDSPASKAGLKAGDVIVESDGVAVNGPLGLVRAINDKKEGDVTLKIVRDRKSQTISLTPLKGIESVL